MVEIDWFIVKKVMDVYDPVENNDVVRAYFILVLYYS